VLDTFFLRVHPNLGPIDSGFWADVSFDISGDTPPPKKPTQVDTLGSGGGVYNFNPNSSDAEILDFNDSLIDNDTLDSFLDTLSAAERRAYTQRVIALQNARGGNLSGGKTEMESVAGALVGGLGLGVGGLVTNGPSLDGIQTGLDGLGLTPAVGIFADGANTIISLARGNWVAAGFNSLAMIPIVGQGTKSGQIGAKILKAADKGGEFGKAVTKTAKAVGEVIHKHHLLPRQFVNKFKDVGLNIEDFKISLPKGKHTLKPDGIHTNSGGNWNKVWKEFFRETPSYSKQDILDQLAKMREQFGI